MGLLSMRTRLVSMLDIPAVHTRISVPAAAMCAALLAICAGPAPASAWESHGTQYSLTIVEGETTLPEYDQIASTSGHVEPNAQVAVSIIRNGTTVYRDVQEHGSAWLSQVPQAGETVTLESPVGTLIGQVVYDGLPSIAPTVCAGSTNFGGENSPGDTVKGFYVTDSLRRDPYGHVTGVNEANYGAAQVKTLSGTTFGGSFLVPLELGETVGAVESLETPLAGEATYTYTSEFQRPVGACPVPPPVYSPPPPPVIPALDGALLKLVRTTIRELLKSGWRDRVSINQPGTVTQALYLQGGTLPAYAASSRHRHHKKAPPALLLARGTVTATSAGTVSVLLRLTSNGRRRLKSAKNVKAVLVTTLISDTGAKMSLARRSVTLHR
jgi:hypothetical protein